MKLSMQQHVELNKMTQHFQQIEAIAEWMGVEVDTFAEELKESDKAISASFKNNLRALATKRQQIFRQTGNRSQESAKSNFTVIVNEDRFRN